MRYYRKLSHLMWTVPSQKLVPLFDAQRADCRVTLYRSAHGMRVLIFPGILFPDRYDRWADAIVGAR
jgi:hypothetical protein